MTDTALSALERPASRRTFLHQAAAAVVTAGTVGACAPSSDAKSQSPSKTAVKTDSDHSGGSMAPHPASAPVKNWEAADAMHEKRHQGVFRRKRPGRAVCCCSHEWKVARRSTSSRAREIDWEVEPGRQVKAWAYNDMVPGPVIRVREGDRVRVVLKNELPESTAVHFHGLELPIDQDGVPFIHAAAHQAGHRRTPTSSPSRTPAHTCTTRT
jgi:FtsP/CotA-like multicopper oxidase with cupredoxin domain